MSTSNVVRANFGKGQPIRDQAAYDAAIKRNIVDNAYRTWRALPRAIEVESFLEVENSKADCAPFYRSLQDGLSKFGRLTDGQMRPILKAIDQRTAKAADIASQPATGAYVGMVKQRIVFPNASVEFVHSFLGTDHNDMPVTKFIYTFRTVEGSKLVWFTENGNFADKGDVLTIKGTVKEHKDYKGEKQTYINRVAVA